jgi:cytosolic carboxypeptidase protein 2/3
MLKKSFLNFSLKSKSRDLFVFISSCEFFNFEDCAFKMQKSKDGTARVVCYREFGVINSYTLEASFFGADRGSSDGEHFTTRHYEVIHA